MVHNLLKDCALFSKIRTKERGNLQIKKVNNTLKGVYLRNISDIV